MMKLPFLKKSSNTFSKFLTISISACDVKCICFYKEDSILKIIGRSRESLDQGSVRNGIVCDYEAVINAAETAVSSATADVGDKAKAVIIGLSSDLCQETVTTAKITRSSIEPITEKEMSEYQKRIIDSAIQQIQTKYGKINGNNDQEFEIITTSLVYTKIDEEKTGTVIGRSGRNIEIAMYCAFCPKHHLKTLQKLVRDLGLKLAAVSSTGFALEKALKTTGMESHDAVLMDVGCDFTNISVIFGGSIVHNLSLHIGKKHFIEEVSRTMGITVTEAAKVVDSYAQGQLSQSESLIIQESLEDVLELWLGGVELLFADFSGVKTFAPCIYLFGEGTQLQEIEDTLLKNPWTKSIPFKAPPQIISLSLENFDKIKNATGAQITKEWLAPACLSYIYEDIE